MADTIGNETVDLENGLLERPDRYSFFQAVRLLQRLSTAKNQPRNGLRIRPDLSFDYPGSEVVEIKSNPDQQRYEVLTSFLGLYGSSSPLPAYYSDDLVDSELEGDESVKNLFDILHQRIYALYFQALKKYRLLYRTEEQSGTELNFLYSLLGISPREISRGIPNPQRFLRYIDIFSREPRSALGLQTVLEDALEGLPVDIQQCVPRKVNIPQDQRFKVGSWGNLLGSNVVLGKEMVDYSGKIAISIGPLTGDQFHDLLNNTKKWMMLTFLIQAYLTIPLECDLKLVLADNEVKHPRLGVPNWSSLGKDVWLFNGDSCSSVAATLHLDFKADTKTTGKQPEQFLNRIALFRSFSEEVRAKIAQRLKHRHYMPNETIFEIGDVGNSMCIIVEGIVGVWIRTGEERLIEVTRLGTGSIIGEMALLNKAPRNATVTSISSTYLFEIEKEDIDLIIEAHPEVGVKLREIAQSRKK